MLRTVAGQTRQSGSQIKGSLEGRSYSVIALGPREEDGRPLERYNGLGRSQRGK